MPPGKKKSDITKRERVCPTATKTQGNKTNKQRQTQPTAAKRLKKRKRRRKEGKKRGRETTRRGKNEKSPKAVPVPDPLFRKPDASIGRKSLSRPIPRALTG